MYAQPGIELNLLHAENCDHSVLLPWRQIYRSAQDVARLDTEKLPPFAVTQVVQLGRFIAPRIPHHSGERIVFPRSEEHTSELQSPCNLVCRLLLEKKKKKEVHS